MKTGAQGETAEDIHNVEAWEEVIEDVLYSPPTVKRAPILELALQKERAERKKERRRSSMMTSG
jgi:hypothetical protein